MISLVLLSLLDRNHFWFYLRTLLSATYYIHMARISIYICLPLTFRVCVFAVSIKLKRVVKCIYFRVSRKHVYVQRYTYITVHAHISVQT